MVLPFALPMMIVATAAPTIALDGAASDALWSDGRLWVAVRRPEGRALLSVDPRAMSQAPAQRVPDGAIFVDACDGRVVLSDAAGLLDASGARLLEARALFAVPDRDALVVADLCGKRGAARGELRAPVVEGIAVVPPGGPPAILQYRHDGRAYSGRVQRGLRPERGYAAALSLYGPRLFDADVDGDGREDLIALHERRIAVWLRRPDGLSVTAAIDATLLPKLGADVELRARVADVEGDRKAELLLAVTRGPVPERTDAFLVGSARGAPFSLTRKLWQRDGLVAPLGVRGKSWVFATVDTSLVSLSAVVLTGRVPVTVAVDGSAEALALQAKIDVRGGRMEGAMPVVDVDFDADGRADLLALGEPGTAALHKGTAGGFALYPARTWQVPPFVHVVPLPELPGVALLGAPVAGKTTLTVLR